MKRVPVFPPDHLPCILDLRTIVIILLYYRIVGIEHKDFFCLKNSNIEVAFRCFSKVRPSLKWLFIAWYRTRKKHLITGVLLLFAVENLG
jgi:hypothetical protein